MNRLHVRLRLPAATSTGVQLSLRHSSVAGYGMPLLMFAILLVQGCASPYGKVLRHYQEAPICCSSIAELPGEPLHPGDKISINLGDGSPVYGFDTGKSYCKVFTLPEQSYPYKVSVSSYLVGAYLKTAYLFYPRLVTLDKQYNIVRSTGEGSFRLVRSDFLEALNTGGDFQYKIEGELSFTDVHREERYLVIMTTDAFLRGKTPVPVKEVPMYILGASESSYARKEEVQVPHAPGGSVAVRVMAQDAIEISAPKANEMSGINESVAVAEDRSNKAGKFEPSASHDASPSALRPETVKVRLTGGKEIGELELGKTSLREAQGMFDKFAAGLGPEKRNTTQFTVGSFPMMPKLLFSPPGTMHQLYFDDNGVLVIVVDGSVAGLPTSGREFRLHFNDARETWRSIGSYELQRDLGSCVTLIAVFRTISDSPDYAAFGYRCPTR